MKTQANSSESAAIKDPEVVAWRREQLLAAGFGPELSDDLARNCGLDLHALVGLTERGCPPRLAVRILAPLDERETRPC
jgi:hypothetical protein